MVTYLIQILFKIIYYFKKKLINLIKYKNGENILKPICNLESVYTTLSHKLLFNLYTSFKNQSTIMLVILFYKQKCCIPQTKINITT